MRTVLLCLSLGALAACGPPGPMTPERAERLCRDEARQADGVSGTVGVGGGTAGPRAGGTITITNNIFNPVPEQEALASCVQRRLAGQPRPSGTTFGITLSGDIR